MLMTKSNIGFFVYQGDITEINNLIWPVLELIQDFIHAPLICKFQEDPVKIEQVMLMTKSNRGFFSNQGDITLIIQSG